MKKFLGLALLASVVTTSAFASVARLEALGEDQYGSQYVNDNRNMFLNAAAINDHYDFATFEWGDTSKRANSESAGASGLDGAKAQGGVFKKSGNLVYGVYFGADSNTASDLRAGGLSALAQSSAPIAQLINQVQNENTLDLFIGGENSWKWGARLSRAHAKDEQGDGSTYSELEKSGLLVGLGAEKGKNSFYLNVGAGNELKIESTLLAAVGATEYHFKGKIGYQAGYVRDLGKGTSVALEYRNQDVEEKEVSALSETWKVERIELTYMKQAKVNDNFTAFYKAAYRTETQENRAFLANQEDYKENFLKATIGFEVMVKEWLHFRGSIANNVIGEIEDTSGDKATITDSTDLRLGATLAFGDFHIDGLIGNDADGDGNVAESGDDNGVLRGDSLMSRVSMTYKF